MKQIDWIEELEKKVEEDRRRLAKEPWWRKPKKGKLQIFDFNCDHCMRKIIVQFRPKPDHQEGLVCLCGRNYVVNAEIVEKWIKDVSIKE